MKIALGIEYDGSDYQGWQSQLHGPSVQATLQKALSFVANESIETICAGRTDAGVHAQCQVVHFTTSAIRESRSWVLGVNSHLPPTVSVRWALPVHEDFHARFSARARRYQYRIINRPTRPALARRFNAWERLPLDSVQMQLASQCLIGEHDFSSFRTVACQALSPVRTIHRIEFTRTGEIISMEIQANAFLHHMVRNIVGTLILIGRGEQPPEWLPEVVAARDRAKAGKTAEACGLVFSGPLYPKEYALPAEVTLPCSP